MSYEKMKQAIAPAIWEHWQNMHDVSVIRRAERMLRQEIEQGILTGFKYYAEYELLCLKLGIENTLGHRL